MRTSLHFLALLLCAVWLLLAAAPAGVRVCLQSSGEIKTGLGCSCQACLTSEMERAGPACDGCCAQDSSASLTGKRCCTCLNLALVLSAPLVKLDPPQMVGTTGGSLAAVMLSLPAFGPICERVTYTHPPPWRSAVVLRL